MTGLRFRVYIGERDGDPDELLPIAAEDWVGRPGDEDGAIIAERHGEMCRRAEAAGKRWRLEVMDPEEPDEPLWFGSDSAGMVMPIQLHPGSPTPLRYHLFNPN